MQKPQNISEVEKLWDETFQLPFPINPRRAKTFVRESILSLLEGLRMEEEKHWQGCINNVSPLDCNGFCQASGKNIIIKQLQEKLNQIIK